MSEYSIFNMDTRTSPLFIDGLNVRLALNGELTTRGSFRKRRGINTAVTIDLVVGTTAPYRIFRWQKDASTSYLVSAGANAECFVNRLNGWLYVRTSAAAAIYSDPSTVVVASWGIGAITGAPTTGQAATVSRLVGGDYVYAQTAYHSTRRIEGAPYLLASTTGGTLTTKMQRIPSPACSTSFTASTLPTGADRLRTYRAQMTIISQSTGWLPKPITDFGLKELRLIEEKAKANGTTTATTDSAGGNYGGILEFADTVVPWAGCVAEYDGRWFYGTIGGYTVYYSRLSCPETYATDTTVDGSTLSATVGETDSGNPVSGTASISVPTSAGTITGIVAREDAILVLCQRGAWSIIRTPLPGVYGFDYNQFWVGCVCQATIADSPYGTWWLAEDGIVLWTGTSRPVVLTRDIIDPEDTNTLFSATLTAAFGAFDVRRNQYVCVIPKSGGGQFALVVQADRLPDEVAVTEWTFGHTSALNGIGYDNVNQRLVFRHASTPATYYAPTANSYKDEHTTTGATYDFSLEVWYPRHGREKMRVSPGVWVTPHRAYVTAAQTMTWAMRGLATTAASGGTDVTGTITMAANEYKAEPIAPQSGVVGRLIRLTLTNSDANPLEIRAIEIGEPAEVVKRHNED